jgi:phage-related tail protein
LSRKVYEISFAIAGKMANSFQGAFRGASVQINRLKADMQALNQQYKKGAISAEEYTAANRRLTSELAREQQAQQRLNSVMQKGHEIRSKMSSMATGAVKGGIGAVGATSLASGFVIGSAIKDAIDFEDAMLGVAKQADGARNANGELTQVYYDMRKQIQLLGREIPLTTNELAAMVESGLRMGVAKDEVIDFTREVSKMATAFELAPDVIGDSMGKIANVMQIPITQLKDLGDTMNYLDDNSVAKGKDIIDVLLRTGGVLKQVNMDAGQGSALASTFLSLGKAPEIAATATNALIRELAIANQQPKHFQQGLEQLGMTSKQVNQGMVKDAQGTILKVLDAINGLD